MVLNYYSLKYVEVQDQKLGLINYAVRLFIFIYIFIYNLGYCNRHFVRERPQGVARLQLQRPTKDHCNPNHAGCEADYTLLKDLPYCHTYEGDEPPPRDGLQSCRYADEKQLNPTGFQHNTMLIPTRVTRQHMKKGDCSTDMDGACKNVYDFEGHDDPEVEETAYVADISRFTLLLDHAFKISNEAVKGGAVSSGASTMYPGAVTVCDDADNSRGCRDVCIPCVNADSPGCVACDNSEVPEELTLFSINVGDIISVGSLLNVTGIDLDHDVNSANESRRMEGFMIQINIEYVNLRPWLMPPWRPGPLEYVYHIEMLPLETYKETSSEITEDGRILYDTHGIFVQAVLTGNIARFDLMGFLLVVTSGLALLAISDNIVDFIATTTCWPNSTAISGAKYDKSRNFNKDMKKNQDDYRKVEIGDDKEVNIWDMDVEDFTTGFVNLDGDVLESTAAWIYHLHTKALAQDKKTDAMEKTLTSVQQGSSRG